MNTYLFVTIFGQAQALDLSRNVLSSLSSCLPDLTLAKKLEQKLSSFPYCFSLLHLQHLTQKSLAATRQHQRQHFRLSFNVQFCCLNIVLVSRSVLSFHHHLFLVEMAYRLHQQKLMYQFSMECYEIICVRNVTPCHAS